MELYRRRDGVQDAFCWRTTRTAADLQTSKRPPDTVPVGWHSVRLGPATARAAWVARWPVIDGPERVVESRPSVVPALYRSLYGPPPPLATRVASNKLVDKVKTSRHVSYAIVLPSFPADLPLSGRNMTQAGLTNRPMKYAQTTEMITVIRPRGGVH